MNTKDIEILLGITEILESHTVYNAQDWKIYNALNAVFNDADFERLHPRDKEGKFAKSGSSFSKDTHKPSKEYADTLQSVSESNKQNIDSNTLIERASKALGRNEQEIREAISFAEKYNEGIKNKHLETQTKYSDGNGVYKRDRAEYHKEIIKDLFKNYKNAKPKENEAPTFIVLGGRGGSGKSKFDMPNEKRQSNIGVYDREKYIVLDADEIKNYLPEYKGYNAYEVHEESSDILKTALIKARKMGLNVVLDGTMKSFGSTEKKIQAFKDAGYNIEMYYMHLPREKAAERAIGRFMGNNGRYVPLDVLADMKENEANFDKLKHYASKWAFYNNDVPSEKDKPILIDKNY